MSEPALRSSWANAYNLAIISKTGKKTDKVDAEKIAKVLRMDMIPECHVPPAHVRGIRNMVRQHVRLTQARTKGRKPDPQPA